MGGFKLGKMTLRSLFSKPATVQYPFEKREPYPAMRGHVVNDIDECILCGLCTRACPVQALAVNRKEGTWTINPYRCIQCGHCIRECPRDSLSMGLTPPEASAHVEAIVMHKEMDEAPAPAKGAAKAAAGERAIKAEKGTGAPARPKVKLTPEQEARVAAARAAKEAKKKAEAEAAAAAASDGAAAAGDAAK